MQSAWVGVLDDQQLRGSVQGVSLARAFYQETDIGVKQIHAHVGMTGMVSASLRHDAEFTAVGTNGAPSHGPVEEWRRDASMVVNDAPPQDVDGDKLLR